MDTFTASRPIERTGFHSASPIDNRIGAYENDDELPGQSLLRDYEQRPFRSQVASEVYAESQERNNCPPCHSRVVPYTVPAEYRDSGYSNAPHRGQIVRNQLERQYADAGGGPIYMQYDGRSVYGTGMNKAPIQSCDAAYDARVNSSQNRETYDRSYYMDQRYDRAYRQDSAQPIVIIDRSPQEYERERHRGPGIGHALLGLAGLAGSVAFSYYGRNGGFNFGHGPWGGYRGAWSNCGAYGGGWNNYQPYRDPYDYGYGWGTGGWNNGYNNRWQLGSWNNNWNDYGHHNNGSWMYPLARMAMATPWMINRNRNCNNGWNNNWNNGGWHRNRSNWRSGWRC